MANTGLSRTLGSGAVFISARCAVGPASVIVPWHVASVGGRTDGPSCCLLFSPSANESRAAAEPRSNESSRVWALLFNM
ncbi:Protein PIH1D3 [Dissostichus eleginoides]|uniref:Protein PIH1D3 n=1 Tax=Dissostichus eleginoides TaxID=100907 RepID=A0AAD9CIW0_DISEL|nr:Protein PIH1D3 [Dissostichus eleginoides]